MLQRIIGLGLQVTHLHLLAPGTDETIIGSISGTAPITDDLRFQSRRSSTARSMASERDATHSLW